MSFLRPGHTLRLTLPLGKTLLLAAAILLLGYAVIEALARSPGIQKNLPVPSIGSSHFEFEYNLAAAHLLMQDTAGIDCLFLGSSMPDTGIDPEIVAAIYNTETGRDITCFNFSLAGAGAFTIGKVSRVLVEELHPKIVIYGTSARDYAQLNLLEAQGKPDPILDIPWIQYRLGHKSWMGWLTEYSFSYRYFLRLKPYFSAQPESQEALYRGVGRYGYNQLLGVKDNFDPDAFIVKEPIYLNYTIEPEHLNGLQDLIGLQDQGVQIIIVEMPFRPAYYELFSDGQDDYLEFSDAVSNLAETTGTPFWRLNDQPDIPIDGWWDVFHLNDTGAKAFSGWLGHRLAQAVLSGEVNEPVQ